MPAANAPTATAPTAPIMPIPTPVLPASPEKEAVGGTLLVPVEVALPVKVCVPLFPELEELVAEPATFLKVPPATRDGDAAAATSRAAD